MSLALAFVMVGVSARPAAAQVTDRTTVARGDTVRLHQGSLELARGTLTDLDSATFSVTHFGDTEAVPVKRSIVDRAEVQHGSRRRGGRAVATGALVGAGVGAGIAAAGIANAGQQERGLAIGLSVALGVASALAGTAIGGVMAFTRTDRWLAFDPITLRVVLPGA